VLSGSRIDSAAAGEQWQKLQQAQEIVTAKVQPLRVNLPVRADILRSRRFCKPKAAGR